MPHHAPRVATEAGIYAGQPLLERAQQKLPAPVVAFRGIPYAAAPVGPRRWLPPAPPPKFADVKPALETGFAPPQPPGGDYNYRTAAHLAGLPDTTLTACHAVQNEDCLHLNVWTPDPDPGGQRPVVVWFHGGAHLWGSATAPKHDGALFAAEQDLVVVSIQFRLGLFGLLAHPGMAEESADGSAGNLTLRDQIAALHWIRRNIAGFGGDPGNVTVTGVSAGARNLLELLVSPAAKGLFDRVILQSPWEGDHHRRQLHESVGTLESALDLGERLGESLGCGSGPEALAKMRMIPVEELLQATLRFGDPTSIWSSVIDGVLLPDDPLKLMEAGLAPPLPILAGCTGDEADIFFVDKLPLTGLEEYRAWVKASFGERADALLELHPGTDLRRSLADLWGDRSFFLPALRAVKAMAEQGNSSYFYAFTHVHPPLGEAMMASTGKKIGAYHASEVPLLFGTLPPLDDKDEDLGRLLRGYWASFAKSGDPNGAGRPQWERFSPERGNCLEIGPDSGELARGVEQWRRERSEVFFRQPVTA